LLTMKLQESWNNWNDRSQPPKPSI
jgi:hypothetical protein